MIGINTNYIQFYNRQYGQAWVCISIQQLQVYNNMQTDCERLTDEVRQCFLMKSYLMSWKQSLVADLSMMTSSNGNVFRVTGPLCGEFMGQLVISPHKGQWRGALTFTLICAWIYGWVNNRKAGDLRRHRAHYDVTVMVCGAKDLENW